MGLTKVRTTLVYAEVYAVLIGDPMVRVRVYPASDPILPGLPAITTDALSVGSGISIRVGNRRFKYFLGII